MSYFDVAGRDAADRLERLDVALQERLLRLSRVDPVDGLARVGQPEDEHVALGPPADHHPDLAEVDLGLLTRGVLLGDERLHPQATLEVDLRAPHTDVVAHRGIRQAFRGVLLDQPRQDPGRGVALLARGHPGPSATWHRSRPCTSPAAARTGPVSSVAVARPRPAPDAPYAGAHHAGAPTPGSTAPRPERPDESQRTVPHVIPSPTPPVLENLRMELRLRWARPNRHNHPGESHVGPDQTVTVGPQQPVTVKG